jgi:hypothetical protein
LQSLVDCEKAKGNGGSLSRPAGWVLALFIAILAATAATVPAGTQSEMVEFDPAGLGFAEEGGLDLVSLRGGRWINRAGEPRLPAVPYRMALPRGAEPVSVRIRVLDSLLVDGEFDIRPSVVPRPIGDEAPAFHAAERAPVYFTDALYPASPGEFVGAGNMDGRPVCDILLYPLRYRPAEGRLVLSTSMVVEVEFRREGPEGGSDRFDPRMLDRLVSNSPEHVSCSPAKVLDLPYAPIAASEVSYLIITDASLVQAFEPLRNWKIRKGVPAEIITVDEIESAYSGSDLQARIRNCIEEYHMDKGVTWVLLGGDTGIIPERRTYVPLSDKTSIPCDLYYADLDGTWNDDGDLRWGEVPDDGVDMYADVYVGRAPVSGVDDAVLFVDKVLAYEGVFGQPGDRFKNMLFLGEILWGDLSDPGDPEYTDGGAAKDMIQAACVPGDFTVQKLYESLYNLNRDSALAALNEGQAIINVNCHGTATSISLGDENLTVDSVMSLAGAPSYGLMYATSCMAGAFDQSSIGEAWVMSPGGGGFFIGNSRYGWGMPGFPGEGPSDHYDKSFFESVFITGFERIGKAHAYAKHEYVAESRCDDYYRYVMYGLNFFGDPEAVLWTDVPAALSVEFPELVEGGMAEFPVTVTSAGEPAQGTTVCLYKEDDIYMVGDTDCLGSMTFHIEPDEPGTLYVTVTGDNCLPYLGYSIVDDGSVGVPALDEEAGLGLALEPNPFLSEVRMVVKAAPRSRVGIEIFDIRGRLVRDVEISGSTSGVNTFAWDGKDASGRRLSPGIYVVKVSTQAHTRSAKALLMR